jgi:adenine specific DNA methylase Mod
MELATNTLYYGDNLEILRKHIPEDSIDLIYLDPPFNSKATYNILYKEQTGELSQAQITAFEDTWQWGIESELALKDIVSSTIAPQPAKELISVLPNFVGKKTPMMAYLTMMCIRLVELKRVLKNTGSIYLHCDPTASHYIKLLLDAIFGANNFRHEIIWKCTSAHSNTKTYGNVHQTIFFYTKSDDFTFSIQYMAYDQQYIDTYYRYKDTDGRRFMSSDLVGHKGVNTEYEWRGITRPWRYPKHRLDELDAQGRIFWTKNDFPRYKRYLEDMPGMPAQSIWTDIQPVVSWSQEGLGYPTQKPEALLERIIAASSNTGDIVLDPFCGCGTTIVASQRLNRKWIGIDITHLAISTMKWRLEQSFHISAGKDYKVIGEPIDVKGAKELAGQNKYQFQWWAVSLIGGQPYGEKKKGADTGIDGYLYFMDEKDKVKKAIISVKGGSVSVSQIRDLVGVIEREKAEMGLFLTLESPTKPMQLEAVSQGLYHSPLGKDYQKIQILTIDEILQGKKPDIPPWISPLATPSYPKKSKGKTAKLL